MIYIIVVQPIDGGAIQSFWECLLFNLMPKLSQPSRQQTVIELYFLPRFILIKGIQLLYDLSFVVMDLEIAADLRSIFTLFT